MLSFLHISNFTLLYLHPTRLWTFKGVIFPFLLQDGIVENTYHSKLLCSSQNLEETGVHPEREAPGLGDSAAAGPSVLLSSHGHV